MDAIGYTIGNLITFTMLVLGNDKSHTFEGPHVTKLPYTERERITASLHDLQQEKADFFAREKEYVVFATLIALLIGAAVVVGVPFLSLGIVGATLDQAIGVTIVSGGLMAAFGIARHIFKIDSFKDAEYKLEKVAWDEKTKPFTFSE